MKNMFSLIMALAFLIQPLFLRAEESGATIEATGPMSEATGPDATEVSTLSLQNGGGDVSSEASSRGTVTSTPATITIGVVSIIATVYLVAKEYSKQKAETNRMYHAANEEINQMKAQGLAFNDMYREGSSDLRAAHDI